MGKHDIEAGVGGDALYPNMMESPQLRWAFIRKVYSIITIQILITIAIGIAVVLIRPIPEFFASHTPLSWGIFVLVILLPLIILIPMTILRNKHPWNVIFLGLFTICISFAVGLCCASRSGKTIIQAAALTALVFFTLTFYTFWAAKKGLDFNFLGPFLFAATMVLVVYWLLQIIIPFGAVGNTIFSCIAAIVFSGYIIYDTDSLIKRHTYDEYVSASISLYLDIINLFTVLLNLSDY